MYQYETIHTSWGPFVVIAQDHGVAGTYLPFRSTGSIDAMLDRRWPGARRSRNLVPGLAHAVKAYFAGQPMDFDVEIDLSGFSGFRRSVMLAARSVRYGDVTTYAELARAVNRPRAARAVGTVMATNPLPLIVPCHRVIRSDGTLGGFSSPDGVGMKQRLLTLEGNADVIHDPARMAG